MSDKDGGNREVAITVEDARHHVHLIGGTGTGKSTLIANLVLQDAAEGRSAVVIDPKGDLVEAIIERLPEGAEERTCVLDPTDRRWAVGLDPLDGEDDNLVVDNVVGIFRRLYENFWGPQTDDLMRAICLTLRHVPGATLTEASLLLFDAHWRHEVMWRLRHIPELNTFWGQFDAHHERTRSEMTRPLLNKLRSFDLRGPLRLVVGQAKPKWSLNELMNSGGILLVRIPKGTLGEDTSKIFGALVFARLWQACMKRVALPEDERADTALYVDEMHNYLTLPKSFEDLLAEARGYRLALVLAHQNMGQLKARQMKDALAANARTKVVFSVSPEDASILERHFLPELDEYDLSHLAAFQGACRPSVDGGHGRAFTFRTKPLAEGSRERAEEVRAKSAELFAEPAEKVMGHIKERQRNASKILLPPTQPDDDPPEGGAQHPAQHPAQHGAHHPAQPRLRVVSDGETPGEEGR